jgi:predicted nucleotidyltransferase
LNFNVSGNVPASIRFTISTPDRRCRAIACAAFAVANDWGMEFTFPQGKILNGSQIFMKPSVALDSNRIMIRRVVESHHARNARVFGSVLRGQDTDSSDLDLLIDPMPETTLFDIGAIRHELGKLLGVPVDILTPNALPDKFREAVLTEAQPV